MLTNSIFIDDDLFFIGVELKLNQCNVFDIFNTIRQTFGSEIKFEDVNISNGKEYSLLRMVLSCVTARKELIINNKEIFLTKICEFGVEIINFFMNEKYFIDQRYPLVQGDFNIGQEKKPERKALTISDHWWNSIFSVFSHTLFGTNFQIFAMDAWNKGFRNGNRLKALIERYENKNDLKVVFDLIIKYLNARQYANVFKIKTIYGKEDIWGNQNNDEKLLKDFIGIKVFVKDSFFLCMDENKEELISDCFYLRSILEGIVESLFGNIDADFINRKYNGFEYKKIVFVLNQNVRIDYKLYTCLSPKIDNINETLSRYDFDNNETKNRILERAKDIFESHLQDKDVGKYCIFYIIEKNNIKILENEQHVL